MFAMNVAMNQLFPFEEVVRQVKKTPGLTWTPAVPEQFKGMTVEQLKARLSHVPAMPQTVQKVRVASVTAAPDSYDNIVSRPECAGTNQDQASCGSCWAFSATTTFSQGRCVQGVDKTFVQYSQEYVVACDPIDMGCNGGWLNMVWKFLKETGDIPLSCVSYKSGNGVTHACPTQCDDGSAFPTFVKAKSYSDVCTSEDSVKNALYTYGNVQTAFSVYYDFEVYSSGIYEHTWGPYMGGHAVTFVGYGEENGVKYWKVQNSWGASWGEAGCFRIVRGTDECGIEDSCYQGYY